MLYETPGVYQKFPRKSSTFTCQLSSIWCNSQVCRSKPFNWFLVYSCLRTNSSCLNPWTPVQATTGHHEHWPLFLFWRHHLWPNLASSVLRFCRRKISFQWYTQIRNLTEKPRAKLRATTHTASYSMVKFANLDDAFSELSLCRIQLRIFSLGRNI